MVFSIKTWSDNEGLCCAQSIVIHQISTQFQDILSRRFWDSVFSLWTIVFGIVVIHHCYILDPLSRCFQCWRYLKMRGCDSECRLSLINGFGIIRIFSCDTMALSCSCSLSLKQWRRIKIEEWWSWNWKSPIHINWNWWFDWIQCGTWHTQNSNINWTFGGSQSWNWFWGVCFKTTQEGGGAHRHQDGTRILWHFCEALDLSNAVAPWLPFIAFASVLCGSEVWIIDVMHLNVVNKDVWSQVRCGPLVFFGHIFFTIRPDIFYLFPFRTETLTGSAWFLWAFKSGNGGILEGRLCLARCNLPRALATLCWPTPQELNAQVHGGDNYRQPKCGINVSETQWIPSSI